MYIFASDPHGTGTPWIEKVNKMKQKYPNAVTVFGGDYIDGNKFSKETIGYVMKATQQDPKHNIAIMGNHEQLFLDYLAGEFGHEGLWFYNGGKSTVRSFCGRGFGKSITRKALWVYARPIIEWVQTLPDLYQTDNLIFVHAGLCLDKQNPIEETTHQQRLWLRERYWYGHQNFVASKPIFQNNPLPKTIVTGHTPTALIKGAFSDGQKTIENVAKSCPIIKVQYANEAARYFCDGGCHGNSSNTGSVAVFNDNGTLVDQIASSQN